MPPSVAELRGIYRFVGVAKMPLQASIFAPRIKGRKKRLSMKQKYDVAAYVWPAYSNTSETKRFWPFPMGEWESVINAVPKFHGHRQPRVPLWGYVNESDPRVMEMEIDAAVEHGVNVFIYDWYFYNDDFFMEKCLTEGFLRARNVNKIKFYLMWANHDVNGVWNKATASNGDLHKVLWDARVTGEQFARIRARALRFFQHPSYYKIDGKPVFMIYDADKFISGFQDIDAAADAIKAFGEEVMQAGFPGLHIQCSLRYDAGTLSPDGITGASVQRDWLEKLGVASMTHYQYIHMDYFKDGDDYSDIADKSFKIMRNIAATYKIPYVPHVTIGWDNNARFNDDVRRNIIANGNPAKFERALREAKKILEESPELPGLVTINSWNEWTEGSYLQPDEHFGYGYLKAVQNVFGKV
jgi:hypothetical protein